jgi:hypothetical protein
MRLNEKGATSIEIAVTVEELGLRQLFKKVMDPGLGRSGIFVVVNGKILPFIAKA